MDSVTGRGKGCGRPGHESATSSKINILNEKIIFFPQKIYKLLSRMKGNSISNMSLLSL
jgi:hypothetical protein